MIRTRKVAAALAVAVALAVTIAGCSSGTDSSSSSEGALPKVSELKKLGTGEGKLNIIVWAGYAEDGSDDPTVDWVTPFEKQTGCQVNAKTAGTSDEMVQLMRTGQYDGVSASGDATLRLIYGGDVAPVNTSLVPNYATISDFLKLKAWNSAGGKMYGIPHGWGANVLMYNPAVVTTAPDSWSAVFDKSSPYAGKITAYDSPIYIADAALYLKATDPSLGITDPYSLTEKQLDASVALLKTQNANIGEYWSDYTKEVEAFESGSSVIGTTWQVIANLVQSDGKADVKTVVPKEGVTGWSDTWMISSKAKHPNCMYEWMNWITSPKVNAEVAEWFGEAPAQTKSCSETSDPTFCATYHATDAAYAAKIHYWTTPQTTCVDGSGKTDCTAYSEWTTKWQQIKGVGRRGPVSAFFATRPRTRLGLLLTPPLLWLVVAYLGSIVVLLVTAFWSINGFTGAVVPSFQLGNLIAVFTEPLYREVTLRTILVALAVTVIDALIAFPMAFYMAKIATPRTRAFFLVAVTTPLWASYLVKAYAWRVLLEPNGPIDIVTGGHSPGYGLPATVITLAYLWLPYMIIPLFAGFDRVPTSLVEASADLGASTGRTVRSVILPLVFPAIAAGSIFTFSLSLGDYIAVTIVGGKTQLLANLIYGQLVTANNQPLAAALSVVPLIAIVLYLLAMRRTGALENV